MNIVCQIFTFSVRTCLRIHSCDDTESLVKLFFVETISLDTLLDFRKKRAD